MMNGLIEKIEQGLNKLLKKFHDANLGKAIDFIAGGLGFEIPRSITIPRLAKGAVIPPNREFMAILGDQKRGVNIETPLDTMIQAFNTALADGGYNGETSVNFTIELDGDTLYKGVKKAENRRAGININNPAFAR
jgi:hypothetical protein